MSDWISGKTGYPTGYPEEPDVRLDIRNNRMSDWISGKTGYRTGYPEKLDIWKNRISNWISGKIGYPTGYPENRISRPTLVKNLMCSCES